jgi:hypothetical protein
MYARFSLSHTYVPTVGTRYVAVGAPEAFDARGEYWRDPSTSNVYWLPPSGALPTEAYVAVAPLLLQIEASARVSVSALSFSGADIGIQVVNCSDVVITDSIFEGFGSTAVHAHYAANANVTIARNGIAHTGSFSLWIDGGGAAPPLTLSGCGAEHNVIMNFGRLGYAFNPAVGIDGVGEQSRSTCSHHILVINFAALISVGPFSCLQGLLYGTISSSAGLLAE